MEKKVGRLITKSSFGVDQISGVIENHSSYISLYIFIFVLFTHSNIDKFKGKKHI